MSSEGYLLNKDYHDYSVHQPNSNAPQAGDALYLTNNLLSSLFPIRKSFINDVCVETQYSGHHIGRIKQLLYANNNLTANRGRSRGLFVLEPNREIAGTCGYNAD